MATPETPESEEEARCACGRLLARLTNAGIELKCSRCRRVVVIEWTAVIDERQRATPPG